MKKISLTLMLFLNATMAILAQQNPPPLTNYQVLKGNINSLKAGDVLVVRNAASPNGTSLDVVMTITGLFTPFKYDNGANGVPSSAVLTFGGIDHGTGVYDNLRFVGVNADKNPWVTYTLHFALAGTATAANLGGTKRPVSNVQSYLPYLSGPAFDPTLPGRKYTNIAGVKTPMSGTVAVMGSKLENNGFFSNPLQYGSPTYPTITDIPPPAGFNMFRDNEVNKSTGIMATPVAPVYGDPDFTVRIDYASYPANGVEYIFGISNNPATPNSDTSDFSPNRTMYVTFVTTDESEPLSATFKNISGNAVGSVLNVSWQTLSETNNAYFNIEASHNGKDFKKIGEVITQATNGNSTTTINYAFSIDKPETAAIGVLSLLLVASGFIVSCNKRKRITLVPVMCILVLLITLVACNKNGERIKIDGNENLFIRIQQVDKNGSSSYSAVVKVMED